MIRKDTRPYETEEQRWEFQPKLNSVQKKVLARLLLEDLNLLKIIKKWVPTDTFYYDSYIFILYLASYDFSDLEIAGFFYSPSCGFWQEKSMEDLYHSILNKFVYYSGHKTYEQMMDDFRQNIRPKMEDEAIQQSNLIDWTKFSLGKLKVLMKSTD